MGLFETKSFQCFECLNLQKETGLCEKGESNLIELVAASGFSAGEILESGEHFSQQVLLPHFLIFQKKGVGG